MTVDDGIELEPEEPGKCNAKRTNTPGARCKHIAGYGTAHYGFGRCKHHFGLTPNPTKLAFQQMAAAMGEPEAIDPYEALRQELARTAGHVKWLESRVQRYPIEDEAETILTAAQQHWFSVYVAERRHLVEVARIAIGAGLIEAQVHLAQQQGELLAMAVDEILGRLQLTNAQKELIPDIVPAVLRALPALEAAPGA